MSFPPGLVVSRALLWVSSICSTPTLVCMAPFLVGLDSEELALRAEWLDFCFRHGTESRPRQRDNCGT